MRNNTVVAIITHRTSTLDTLPDALNQSEIGFASDANRLFIGNPNNPELQTRTAFPYKNVEILTEFSNLINYVKYSYVNNIDKVEGETDRGNLIEQIPILVVCSAYTPSAEAKEVILNGVTIQIPANANINEVVVAINAKSGESFVTASSTNGESLFLFCTRPALEIGGSADIMTVLGIPADRKSLSELLPERKLNEKLDDTLHITDYGIKPSTGEDVSRALATALVGIYGRYSDNQFKREVFFPAGTYQLNGNNSNDFSVPLLSGTNLRGEGIDRTIIQSDENLFDNYLFQTMDSLHEYANSTAYISNGIAASDIILRDMTIICNAGKGALLLRNAKNIILQNVRIVNGSSGDTIKVYGDGEEAVSSDILIDGCQIEGGNRSFVIEKNAKNVLVSNTRFQGSNENFVIIGSDDIANCNVRAVSFNNNIFTKSNGTNVLNRVLGGTEYITFTNSTFDKDVSEYTNDAPLPFNVDYNASGKNYTDTLNPTTDTRKVLQFRFRQPEWVYLNQLITSKGVLGINVRENDEEIPASEKQFLDVAVKTETLASGEEFKHLELSVEGTPDIVDMQIRNKKGEILLSSKGDLTLESTGNEIVAKSDIDLNDNALSNAKGVGNLTLKTTKDNIVVVEDVDPTKTYGERANSVGNAVVTVDMLKQLGNTFSYELTPESQFSDGLLLIDNLSNKYRTGLKLKAIELNFKNRNFIVKQYADANAVKYKTDHSYYAGDVVKGEGNSPLYYVVTSNFTSGFDTAAEGVENGEPLLLISNSFENGAVSADVLIEDKANNKFYSIGPVYDLLGGVTQVVSCSRVDVFNTDVKRYVPFMPLSIGDVVQYQDCLYKAINPSVDVVTSWEGMLPELDLSGATSVSKLTFGLTNSLEAAVVFGIEDDSGETSYYKITNGALVEVESSVVLTAEGILQNGNTVAEIEALTTLPLNGKIVYPIVAIVMEDLTVVSTGNYTCTYKHLVDEVEAEATITSETTTIFDPDYIKDDADARVLWLHNPTKFERLPSETGYSFELTGANGVKELPTKETVNGGTMVDVSDIDLSAASLYVRFFDGERNLLKPTVTNYSLFPTFKVNVVLGVYE